MVLLDDVVEVFRLAQHNVDAGVSLDALNGRCVGATLVDGDLLWHVVQVDSLFKKATGRSPIPLGSQQEIHCVTSTVNCAVEILPLASHLDIGLVHPPTLANGVLAPTKNGDQHRQHLDCPAVHCRVVNKNTTLVHHLLDVAKAQWVGHVPAHTGEHDFQRIVKPLEDLVQGAVEQTLAEINHRPDCRLCLLRQNPLKSKV